MKHEIFEFDLIDRNVDTWHRIFIEKLGISCVLEKDRSIGSCVRGWSVGDLLLVDARLAHQTLSSLEQQGDAGVLLQVVTSGKLIVEQGSRVRASAPGAMLLIDTGQPYRERIQETTRVVTVKIPRRSLRERGFKQGFQQLGSPDTTGADVRVVRDFILAVAGQNAATSSAMRRRQANQLLDMIDVVIEDASALARVPSGEATLFRAKRYIDRNLRNAKLSAAAITSGVGASEVHLNRLFRVEGTSLMRYVWNRRLEVACRLLLRSGIRHAKIQEVALQCGFSTHTHFCRIFKQRYGVSASEAMANSNAVSEFRKRVRLENSLAIDPIPELDEEH
ncbi:helix-turn-helix domain-containing protein [Paraburkholderia jirisanensis]